MASEVEFDKPIRVDFLAIKDIASGSELVVSCYGTTVARETPLSGFDVSKRATGKLKWLGQAHRKWTKPVFNHHTN